jgi:hypothetical protein
MGSTDCGKKKEGRKNKEGRKKAVRMAPKKKAKSENGAKVTDSGEDGSVLA